MARRVSRFKCITRKKFKNLSKKLKTFLSCFGLLKDRYAKSQLNKNSLKFELFFFVFFSARGSAPKSS